MNPTIYLSCVVCIIGSLVWTASAQGDFESERTRVLGIYGNPNVDQDTKIRNIPLAVDFLDKYSDRIEMTPEQRVSVVSALKIYKKEQGQDITISSPLQGSIWWYVRPIFIKDFVNIASSELKKGT